MKKNIKYIVIVINIIILVFSVFWMYKSKFQYEPVIVLLGQISSLIVLLFEEKLSSKMKIDTISDSDVQLDVTKEDNGEYEITNVNKKSNVNIKKS